MSLKVAPLSKSTACILTSRVRIHAVSDAGTVRPCAVRTSLDQSASGRSRHSTDRCTAEWSNRFRRAIGESVAPNWISSPGASGGRVHGRLNAGAGPFDEPRDGPGVIAYVCYKVAAGPARKAGTAVELFIGKFVELTGEERGPAPRLQEVFLQAPIGS